jgi:probable rRNA maturation factor
MVNDKKIAELVDWIFKNFGSGRQWRINIILTDDLFITDLNKKYLHKSSTTDVIAFDLSDEQIDEGEIYISTDKAKNQAKFYNVSLENELVRLIAHGSLHLLGFTDLSDAERAEMTAYEDRAIEKYFDISP